MARMFCARASTSCYEERVTLGVAVGQISKQRPGSTSTKHWKVVTSLVASLADVSTSVSSRTGNAGR